MTCNDPRHSDEQRARAALEQMDDDALTAMVKMMEEVAKKHPRPPRAELKIVTPPEPSA
jgi:5,10-methenyltetrahydromethanopterin hydrogenase